MDGLHELLRLSLTSPIAFASPTRKLLSFYDTCKKAWNQLLSQILYKSMQDSWLHIACRFHDDALVEWNDIKADILSHMETTANLAMKSKQGARLLGILRSSRKSKRLNK